MSRPRRPRVASRCGRGSQRSCEITRTQPANSSNASSSARSVSTSRSFHGSSSRRRLPPAISVFSRCSRRRSPPAARELAEEFLLVGALAVEAADGRHVPARARRSNGRTAAIRHGAPAVATRSTRAIPRRAGTPTNDVPAALPSTSAGHRSTAAATAATPRAVAAESLLAARASPGGRLGRMHTRPRSVGRARRGDADSRAPHQPLARKRAAR